MIPRYIDVGNGIMHHGVFKEHNVRLSRGSTILSSLLLGLRCHHPSRFKLQIARETMKRTTDVRVQFATETFELEQDFKNVRETITKKSQTSNVQRQQPILTMMASSRWTSFSFLFLAVIHVSSAFCPSSLRSTTFTRSVFSSNSNSNPNSNGIGVLVLSSTENDDVDVSPTYYSPNVPLADSTDDDDDQYFLSSVSPSPDVTTAAGSTNEYSFFDEAIIRVRGGSGGQGSSTFKLMPGGQDGPPDGGNGGGGGNVVLEMDPTLNSLAGLTQAWRPNAFGGSGAASQTQLPSPKSFRAENGGDGDRQFKNGRFGKYVSIRVPPGTVVQHQWTVTEGDNVTVHLVDLGSLTLEENSLIVAMGGDGGEGSCVTGKKGGSRRARCPPTGGERKTLKLTLKMVADVALVGVPNTGKSTFLASVTRAKPKIANVSYSCW
jgi:hypothetical protein